VPGLADLVAADLVAADLVPGAGARDPRHLVRALVAADLVPGPASPGACLVARWPRHLVRAPWCVARGPPGPKKRAGSLAARALALFHTVSFT
jgi:hypothetical protein